MAFNSKSYKDWMNQAEKTLESASSDQSNGFFSWACFKAQQSAEFALKAVLYGLGLPAFGHSITDLAKNVSDSEQSLSFDQDCMIFLDKLYIPTRYADAFASGAPYKFYTIADAQQAINCATQILSTLSAYGQGFLPEGDEL